MNKHNFRLLIIFPLLVLIIIFTSFMAFIRSPFFEDLYYNDLSATINEEMADVIAGFSFTDQNDNQALINRFQENTDAGLMILDVKGSPVQSTPNLSNTDSMQHKEIMKFIETWIENPSLYDSVVDGGGTAELNLVGSFSGIESTVLIQAVRHNGTTVGIMFCMYPIQALTPTTDFIYESLLPGLIVAMLSILLICWIFAGRYGQPLDELAMIISSAVGKPHGNLSLGTPRKVSEYITAEVTHLAELNSELRDELHIREQEAIQRAAFTGRVSHELKTPIGLIRGYSEALRDRIHNDTKREHYQSVIIDETLKMESLLNDLMDLALLETGNYKLNPLPFQMKPLIMEVLSAIHPELAQKKCYSTVNSTEEDLIVFADEDRIRQVLRNILNNALRHMEEQDVISVSISMQGLHSLLIQIENSGPQIPEELIPLIWDQFYTIDPSGNRDRDGSGLGLAIVRNILTLHGSRYGVRNTDEGVLFYFTLPLYS